MKKIFLVIIGALLGLNVFSQFLTDVSAGMTGSQTRNAINGNNTILEDTVHYFYTVNGINGPAIDTALARAGRVGNGYAPPYFDGTQNGGQTLFFWGNGGFWTALQGGAPTANRSYRLPIQALPGAGLRAFMVIDQYGNMQFKDSADVGGGGAGDLAFADTVNATGFLETQFRVDTAKTAIREEIQAISTGTGFVEIVDSSGTAAGSYVTGADFVAGQDLKANLISPVFTTPNIGSATGSVTGNAGTVTGFTPASGSLTLSGADALTFTTTNATNVTLPTTGTLATTSDINDSIIALFNAGELGLALADSNHLVVGHYATPIAVSNGGLTRFHRAGGSLTLSGGDSVTITTTANSNVTLPTSGTLVNETQLNALVDAKKDTMEFFCFAAGMGLTADTAGFQTTSDYGGWFHKGRDTLMITELRTTLGNGPGSDTLSLQIWVNDTLTTTYAAKLFTTAHAVGDSTGTFGIGDVATSFSTTPFKIPPGNHVWMTSPFVSAGNKPTKIRSTLSGYKKNGQY